MAFCLTNDSVKSAVLASGKPDCFIAGADISWLDAAKDKDEVSNDVPVSYLIKSACVIHLPSLSLQ